MNTLPSLDASEALNALVDRIGRHVWQARMLELKRGCAPTYAGRALNQLHALELTVERARRAGRDVALSETDRRVACLAAALVAAADQLTAAGRVRLDAALASAMRGPGNLVALFHLMRTACLQRQRGFEVAFAGLDEGAPYDLLLHRQGSEAELVCEVISAEAGRDLHRRAWSQLMDRVDPDLQSWLAAHPGRYLLKMTLPRGLRHVSEAALRDGGSEAALGEGGSKSAPCDEAQGALCAGGKAALRGGERAALRGGDKAAPRDGEGAPKLAELHRRITLMLIERRRADHDEAAVLRLDPLMLAAAQMGEGASVQSSLLPRLRREFGHEAHLAVTSAGTGVFVMAARAGREDEVAGAVHRRMAEIAPRRLTGTRPGILAMFIEDTDRLEWHALRAQLQLEAEARHFMTRPEARAVVAVTCASRLELLGPDELEGQPCCELRFRNPAHPDAKLAALAPAVLSSH